ncbi:MAG: DNA polymerase III subunit delta [Deltaproteobacteria bacterium]|nr:DNA polymerase III subunit delta [Deltaproteobacteria bacterium]
MSHPMIERHLERRAVKPLYVFYGDEEFLMDRALARLEDGLRDDQGEPPVKSLFYAPSPRPRKGLGDDQEESPVKGGREAYESGVAEFLTESRVASLWGPGQLLVLRRVELTAAALKAVSDYLDHPANRTWVVLLAEGAKTRDLAKNPVWARLQREKAALGFFHLKESELFQWLNQEAKVLGKTLDLAAAQRLVEIVGNNLAELSQELEKLALYAGGEKTLTPNLVNQLSTHSRTFNIFALVEALGEPGVHKRLTALGQLLDLGEPPAKILVMLARQLRLLIHVKEGPSAQVPQWNLRNLAQQAARFSETALRAHLFLLHQIDLQLKTSAGSPRLWLEWALLKMGPG